MCNNKNHHFNCFNPPAMQSSSLANGTRLNSNTIEEESREARRNRRRANRRRNSSVQSVYRLMDGETGDKNREIYSGADSAVKRTESSTAASGNEDVDLLFDYCGKIFHFFEKEFRRNSINGGKPGSGMPIVVKAQHRTDTNQQVANSFWDLKEKRILVGEGDEVRRSYAWDLTVVAHEYMHGIIQHTQRGMAKTNEAGALNESIADAFACMIVQYYNWHNGKFPQAGGQQKVEDAEWKVGAYIFKENDMDYVQGMAVRSLKEPGLTYGHLFLSEILGGHPQHYANYATNKGPYANCGIPNHAFYLLSTALGGHSWEKAGQIWYNALLANDDPQLNFKDWANLTVKEARKLFGRNDPAFDETKNAWRKVGVL